MNLSIADDAWGLGQILPAGTVVNISSSAGSVSGTTSFTINNSVGYINTQGIDQYGGTTVTFSLDNPFFGTVDDEGLLTFSFTFPSSGTTFSFSVPIKML
jgi:hypothetical protein